MHNPHMVHGSDAHFLVERSSSVVLLHLAIEGLYFDSLIRLNPNVLKEQQYTLYIYIIN